MKFTELISKYHKDKTAVFVNGVGVGRIATIENDFISLEVVKEQEKGKGKKLVKETTHIPMDKVEAISEGEKDVPKNEEDEKIDNDLGDL